MGENDLSEFEKRTEMPESMNVGKLNRAVRALREDLYQKSLAEQAVRERFDAAVTEAAKLREALAKLARDFDAVKRIEVGSVFLNTCSARIGNWDATARDALEATPLAGTALQTAHELRLLKEEVEGTNPLSANPSDWGLRAMFEGKCEQNEALENEVAALKTLVGNPWEGMDKPTVFDAQIQAQHPVRSKNHERYARAAWLVSAKHSKYALVDLVNWLLFRVEEEKQ